MIEQLTIEQVEALKYLNIGGIEADEEYHSRHYEVINSLVHDGLADRVGYQPQRERISITDTGRKALAAYKAQRKVALFIAEFEEWLEAEIEKYEYVIWDDKAYGEHSALYKVLIKYRACKERMET